VEGGQDGQDLNKRFCISSFRIEFKMTVKKLLQQLEQRNISIFADEDGQLIVRPANALTAEIRAALKKHKSILVKILAEPKPYRVIDYEFSNLYGVLPVNYVWLDDKTVRALYRTFQEFASHIIAAAWAKQDFEDAPSLPQACEALGGVVNGIQTK